MLFYGFAVGLIAGDGYNHMGYESTKRHFCLPDDIAIINLATTLSKHFSKKSLPPDGGGVSSAVLALIQNYPCINSTK